MSPPPSWHRAERASLFELFGSLTSQGVGVVFVHPPPRRGAVGGATAPRCSGRGGGGRSSRARPPGGRGRTRAAHRSVMTRPTRRCRALPTALTGAAVHMAADGAGDVLVEVQGGLRRAAVGPGTARPGPSRSAVARCSASPGSRGQRPAGTLRAADRFVEARCRAPSSSTAGRWGTTRRRSVSELVGDVPDDHFLATCGELSVWREHRPSGPSPGRRRRRPATRCASAGPRPNWWRSSTSAPTASDAPVAPALRRQSSTRDPGPRVAQATRCCWSPPTPPGGLDVRSAEQGPVLGCAA